MTIQQSRITRRTLFLRVAISEIFQVGLLTYFLLFLLEYLQMGFVTFFFNLNILLGVVLVSGVITATIPAVQVSRQPTSFTVVTRLFLSFADGVVVFLLILAKAKSLQSDVVIVGIFCGILALGLTYILTETREEEDILKKISR